MSNSYTLEQLTAASDEELAQIAAEEVMGWKLEEVEEFSDRDWCFGNANQPYLYQTYNNESGFMCDFNKWRPATDRNQSRMLLAKVASEKGIGFSLEIGRVWLVSPDPKPMVCVYLRNDRKYPDMEIHGNDARAETIAAILAAQAA